VIVVDTLSPYLDMQTIRNFKSSHAYEVEYKRDRSITFTFDDILLVDSFTNEPGSNGYISFDIDQQKQVPLETVISNQAAIYFDFNKPIFTNMTIHRVGEDFYEKKTVSTTVSNLEKLQIIIYPNPLAEYAVLSFNKKISKKARLNVYDYLGNLVQQYPIPSQSQSIKIARNGFPAGTYFFQAIASEEILGSGKVIIQ